jgi:hypothetical protein
MSGPFFRTAALAASATLSACSAGTSGTGSNPAPAGYAAQATDTTPPSAADSAAARLGRHVGFRQAIGDATRLGIVTGYSEVLPGRVALMLGSGFSTSSTVEYHLKRIYSAYGDYLHHTLAPVLELHNGNEIVGDYSWEGLALTSKVGPGT